MTSFKDNFGNPDDGKNFFPLYNHSDISYQGHSIFQMNEIGHRFYGRDIHNDSFNFRREIYTDLAVTKAAYDLSGCNPTLVNNIVNNSNVYGMGNTASNIYSMGAASSNLYSMNTFGLENRYSSYSNMSNGSTHNREPYDGSSSSHNFSSDNNIGESTSVCKDEKSYNDKNICNEGSVFKTFFNNHGNDQRCEVNNIHEEDKAQKHPAGTADDALNAHSEHPGNNDSFLCKLCKKTITVVNSFQQSMEDHAKMYHGSIYFCFFCSRSYKWKKSLDNHLVKFHSNLIPFSCDLCGEECQNDYNLSVHKKSHCNFQRNMADDMHQRKDGLGETHQDKYYTCPLCSDDFDAKDELRDHIESCHLTEPFHECETCGKKSEDQPDVDIVSENPGFPFMCDICKKCFCNNSMLMQHKLAIHALKKPECCTCGKDFASVDIMKRHMLLHSDEVRFLCDVCGKTFFRIDRFNKHLKRHMEEKPFECNACNKTFRDKYILNLHSRKHTGEKPFLCNICGKNFSSKGTLKIHISRHTGDSQYKCDICNKTFAYNTYRKAHMRIHTNEKPFKCSLCPKEFTQKCSLNFHMLRHSGERKHVCTICKKAFLHMNYLNVHMRTHTGEKPYRCSSCGKAFTQKSTLNTHKKQKCT